jgi:hypothetical protein
MIDLYKCVEQDPLSPSIRLNVKYGDQGYRFHVSRPPLQEEIERALGPLVRNEVIEAINRQKLIFEPADFAILFWRQATLPFQEVEAKFKRFSMKSANILQIISFWIAYPKEIDTIIFELKKLLGC